MNIALILSGGTGSRMGLDIPKQYVEVNGKPVIVYTLEKFERCKEIDKIVITADTDFTADIEKWLKAYDIKKVSGFALPGDTRQESILNGLNVCMKNSVNDNDNVIIHDAARPMVSEELIVACLKQLEYHDGCMPVLPISDTVYQSNDGKCISGLLDRNTLFSGQAPEAFKLKKYTEINRSLSKAELQNIKGSSEIAYHCHMDVALIPGDDMNFKLTTPGDMERFKTIVGGIGSEGL